MPSPTQRELDHTFRMRLLQLIQQAFKYACICFAVCIALHYVYLSVRELAGRTTIAEMKGLLNLAIKTPKGFALMSSWGFTGAAITWGVRERRRSKRIIAKFHPERRQKQLKVDRKKGSSGITLRGETGPKDE